MDIIQVVLETNQTDEIIGASVYSEVKTYEEKDVHGKNVEHGKKHGVVAKEAKGIGKHFTPQEIAINRKIQTVVDSSGGKQFIVEFLKESEDGRLIFERLLGNLEETPLLSPVEMGKMVASVANGAIFLDSLGIKHNDLHRIENIFVSQEGEFKIGDFNLSESLSGRSSGTGNLDSLCLMVRSYIAEKILGIKDAYDMLVDVGLEVSNTDKISISLKALLLEFFDTKLEPEKRLRLLAKGLLDSGRESWN